MPKYTLDAGRCIVKDGTPLATLHGVGNYDPTELDELAREIVRLLRKRAPNPYSDVYQLTDDEVVK